VAFYSAVTHSFSNVRRCDEREFSPADGAFADLKIAAEEGHDGVGLREPLLVGVALIFRHDGKRVDFSGEFSREGIATESMDE